MVQLFQRRVLTYEPGAPTAYQVQMGNVGQQYYSWRYGVQQPANSKTRLTIATTRTNSNTLDQASAYGDIYQTDADGSNKVQINKQSSGVYNLILNNTGTTQSLPNPDYYPEPANIYKRPAPNESGVAFLADQPNSTSTAILVSGTVKNISNGEPSTMVYIESVF